MRAVILLALLVTVSQTGADVDLWGHVRFGEDIVRQQTIPDTDPYSFTSDRSWVNHEWLAEVVFYLAWATGGAAGLNAVKLLIMFAVAAILTRAVQASGASPRVTLILVVMAMVFAYPRMQYVRPQLFSMTAFALLLRAFWHADSHGFRSLLWLPLLFAAWANMHGGWLVGIGLLGVWSVVHVCTRPQSRTDQIGILGLASGCVVATLVNPYGIGLWQFLWETVSFQRADIVEWLPITAAPPFVLGTWLATLGLAVVSLLRSSSVRWDHLAVLATLSVASARVNRLDAFLVLAVFLLLTPQLVAVFTRREPRATSEATVNPSAGRWVRHAGVAIVVAGLAWSATRVQCITMDGFWVPEASAARFVRQHALKGRLVPAFAWGEYAIWHFPSLKVSIDGRRETVYSEAVVDAHLALYSGGQEGLEYVNDLGADYVWLPRLFPSVELLRSAGWHTAFEGTHSVILSRHRPDRGPARVVGSEPPDARCFPGP